MLELFLTVKDRKLVWPQQQRDLLQAFLNKYESELYRITVDIERGNRSNDQNKLYWKRMAVLATATGETSETLHELAMSDCGYGETRQLFGKDIFIRHSSKHLDTKEFTALTKWQSDKARYLNDGLDPDEYLKLPAGIDKRTGQYIYEINGVI